MATISEDADLRLFERLKQIYQPLHAEFERDEALIEGRFGGEMIPADWADDGLQPTIPPTASDAIDNAADHILHFPRVFVPTRPVEKDIEKAQEAAERLRQFYSMFWGRVFEDGDPLGMGKKSLVKGMLCLKFEIRWDLIPVYTENMSKDAYRREIERASSNDFIFRISVAPKETVFPDPLDPWNPRYLYVHYDITCDEALDRFGDKMSSDLKMYCAADPFATLKYTEKWELPRGDSSGKYICWIEDERVHNEINPYSWQRPDGTYTGFIPYCVGAPGFGDIDKDNRPEKVFVSNIRRARSVIVSEARFLTELESWLRTYVWPMLNTMNMPDDEGKIRMGPGGHIDRTEGQELAVINWGDVPVGLLQGLARVNAYVDQTTKFSTLGGIAQRGVDTATEADMNVRNASTKLSGMVNMLRRMVMRINSWTGMSVENVLGVPVTIMGAIQNAPGTVTVKPTDFNGFYYTMVELDTSDEAALNLRTARTWSDLFHVLPGLSEKTVMEKIGIPNPVEEQDSRAVENLLNSMPAQQALLMMMLAGMGTDAKAVMEAFQSVLPNVLAGGRGAGAPGGGGGNFPAPATGAAQQAIQQAQESQQQTSPERQYQ